MKRIGGPRKATNPSQVPHGHGVSAHMLFGECAACPGVSFADELVSWRRWARDRIDTLITLDEKK